MALHEELGEKTGVNNVDDNMDAEGAYDPHVDGTMDEGTYNLFLQEERSEDDPVVVGVGDMDILQHLMCVCTVVAEQKEDVVADGAHIVGVVGEDVLTLLDCTDRVAIDSEMQVVDLALFLLIASYLLVGVQLGLASLSRVVEISAVWLSTNGS